MNPSLGHRTCCGLLTYSNIQDVSTILDERDRRWCECRGLKWSAILLQLMGRRDSSGMWSRGICVPTQRKQPHHTQEQKPQCRNDENEDLGTSFLHFYALYVEGRGE